MFLYIKFSIEVGEKAQSQEPDSRLWVPEWETQHPWKIWAQWYIYFITIEYWLKNASNLAIEAVGFHMCAPTPRGCLGWEFKSHSLCSTTHSLPTEPSSPLPHMFLFWYLFPVLLYLSTVPYSAIALWFCVCYNMSSSMLWMYMTYINYWFIHAVLGAVFWS